VGESSILPRLRALLGDQFQELGGAALSGEVPLSNRVLNSVIAEGLARSGGPVSEARVEALDDDTFSVHLSLRGRMLPSVRVLARIEQQPELPQRPVLVIRWSIPGMGPLAMLGGPALSFLKALPRGFRAEDDRIVVDLGELASSQGAGELLRYLSKLRIHTRKGAVLITFAAKI
jgi:hypothetical protein